VFLILFIYDANMKIHNGKLKILFYSSEVRDIGLTKMRHFTCRMRGKYDRSIIF